MKKLAAILCLSALTTGAFAQGLVDFLNSATTLSSVTVAGVSSATSGAAGSWYYGLLIAPAGTANPDAFTFSGAYATNIAAAGRFFGGSSVAVTGWAAGASESYEIAGWSASLGWAFQSSWLTTPPAGAFGLSPIATQVSGGAGSPASPPTPLFGGANGIQAGFTLTTVPEPTSMALAGLGAAALLIFRRRK